jgi:glycosyltransferase involved in cell wall biosynthesis
VPLVITAEGCTAEYFGPGAFYANPKSVEDIAAKIAQALQAPRNGAVLREQVRQFAWDRVAEELEQAYLMAQAAVAARV